MDQPGIAARSKACPCRRATARLKPATGRPPRRHPQRGNCRPASIAVKKAADRPAFPGPQAPPPRGPRPACDKDHRGMGARMGVGDVREPVETGLRCLAGHVRCREGKVQIEAAWPGPCALITRAALPENSVLANPWSSGGVMPPCQSETERDSCVKRSVLPKVAPGNRPNRRFAGPQAELAWPRCHLPAIAMRSPASRRTSAVGVRAILRSGGKAALACRTTRPSSV